ncbi:MAG TPA: cupin domain-containing protein [Spirochaetota bacterium]|nr:cupin domain-containing protein [Spirochaetota bacterium]
MEFINAESVRVYENPGVKSRQLLNPGNSASERITVTRVQVEPGAEQPRHTHENSEQVWIAVRGKGTLLLGDSSEKNICEGDVVRFADGDVHGLLNNSDEVFEYISVTSPPLDFSNVYVKR